MNIDVALLPTSLETAELHGKAVVVADILRATSTMIAAFEQGVAQISPVETVEDARKLAQLYPNSLLVGEEFNLRPKDFHYDNSPADLIQDSTLHGKHLIMRSTNGTRLLKQLQQLHVAEILIGAFLNLEALVTILHSRKQDLLICCAGNGGRGCFEDIGFAGALVERLKEKNPQALLTDTAMVALHLWNGVGQDIDALFAQSAHAAELRHMGRAQDVELIAQESFLVVPIFSGRTGLITTSPQMAFPKAPAG